MGCQSMYEGQTRPISAFVTVSKPVAKPAPYYERFRPKKRGPRVIYKR